MTVLADNTSDQRNIKMEKHELFAIELGIKFTEESEQNSAIVAAPWECIFKSFISNTNNNYNIQPSSPGFISKSIVSKSWDLTLDNDEIVFEIGVTSSFKEAMMYMLEEASQTTMVKIPFIKAATMIGDYTLTSNTENSCIYWVFCNICMKLVSSTRKTDLFLIASKIQSTVAACLINSNDLPSPALDNDKTDFSIEKSQILTLTLKNTPATASFLIHAITDGSNVKINKVTNSEIKIEGVVEGQTTVHIIHADPVTLLSKVLTLSITVHASK